MANGAILAARNKNGINQIFNITCGKGQSLYKFVLLLKKKFPNLQYQIEKKDISKPSRGTLSIKKAQKLLGYKPNFNLEIGITEYVKFLKKIKFFNFCEKKDIFLFCPFIHDGGLEKTLKIYSSFLSKKFNVFLITNTFNKKD